MSDKSAIETLKDIRSGLFVQELNEKFHNLVQACQDTGKMGTLSLTIKIKPDRGSGTAMVEDALKVSVPQEPRSTMFHITPDSNLSLRDVRQREITGLESVESGKNVESINKAKKVENI